ncbi:Maltose/maltodextrin-binding protein precursor [Anaerococcus prevotii]|uniref:Extracellular solute-binding protein family 1 n=1 Tax=Anaerococcus prevotii (strain ATCC 9321 / DSM 20548 / JCM 6508 / NCTC 11806 / PC1) TaxID=525919 RepID=C7RFC0_ANAPD|nr:sugar ABC transporter substrate-binding protein [Anaerococcus prevotii]ACV28181.1 extracellular solute-binding protein family 1 [Anaerococcus prevotii DSM 20548]SUU93735.1 Maltose/maltodextrin-binding protein precursor [Anaerococcus prevotii]
MKNKLKMLMALSLSVVLAACGGKGADKGEEAAADPGDVSGKISVQVEKEWMDHYEKAAERVKEKYPNAEIELKEVGAFDHLDILDQTDANNEDVADLFAIPADRLVGLVNNDILGAIDSKALADEIGGWDDFDKGIGGNFNIDGEYFAFPYNIETLITYVNKKNAEEKGVDLSKPIELNDVADESTVLLPIFDAWYGVAATNSSNIELLGKDDQGNLFSDLTKDWKDLEPEKQATIKALFEYWKKHNDAGTQLFDPDAGWGYIDDTFKEGKGGVARIGGAWDAAPISEQAGEGNLEVYPIDNITIAGKPLNHWQGGWGLAINARIEEDANKKAIANEMIKQIVNPEFAIDLYKSTGKILENVKNEDYQSSDLADSDKAIIEATIKSYETAPARPLFKEWGDVWDTYKNAILSWNSVKPANEEEAYNQLKASFDSMMANFSK